MIFVDVSHWNPEAAAVAGRATNSEMNWGTAVQNGLCGAVVKFSQGTNVMDPAALLHTHNASMGGVPLLGAYHFGTGENGATQAAWFLNCVKQSYGTDLSNVMLMLDAERNTVDQMRVSDASAFAQYIHATLGRWPWLYVGKYGTDGKGNGLPNAVLSNCQLLCPAYGKHQDNLGAILPLGWTVPTSPGPAPGLLRGWQFTDGTVNGGPFPGIGVVDQSEFIGVSTLSEARAIWTF
jgi:lysozyme